MKRTICLIILTSAILCGCVKAKTITGPDGAPIHNISCDGLAFNITDCMEKAGEICGERGYTVLGADQQQTSGTMAFATGNKANPLGYVPMNKFSRNLLVRCN